MNMNSLASRLRAPVRALCLLTAVGTSATAMELGGKPEFRVAVAGWYAVFDGEWRADTGASAGEVITSDETGVDDYTFGAMVDGSIGMPWVADFEFGGFVYMTDGEKTLTQNTNFGDAAFLNGDHVKSDANMTDAYIGVSFRLLDTPLGWLSAGAVVHVMQGEVTMESPSDSDTIDETVGCPAVTLRGAVNCLPILTVGAGIQWMSLSVGDADIDLLDAQAYVEWKPFSTIGVIAGYRIVDVQVEVESDDDFSRVDAEIGGPFLGVVVSIL